MACLVALLAPPLWLSNLPYAARVVILQCLKVNFVHATSACNFQPFAHTRTPGCQVDRMQEEEVLREEAEKRRERLVRFLACTEGDSKASDFVIGAK